MAVHAGLFGMVNGQSTVRNWSVSDAATSVAYGASNLRAGTHRKRGVNSWSGSFAGNGGLPAVMPGETFTFTGYTAPTTGVHGTAGITYSGTAIVDSVEITWNFSTNEIVQWKVNFSGHLALVKGTGTETDATTPVHPLTAATKVEYFNVSWQELSNVVSVTLTISAANQDYVDSSTIVSGVAWTGKKEGRIDWNANIVLNTDDQPLAKGSDQQLRLYTDASLFWLLEWGHLRDYTNLNVDNDSGAILQQTMAFEKAGLDPTTSALGTITKPGGTVFWPKP